MRDVVIGASSGLDWDTLRYWANSLEQSGFAGDKVIILMNCDRRTVREFMDRDFVVVGFEENDHGDYVHESALVPHVERFIHVHDYVRRNGPFRWVITTDVRDVVFQQDPVVWLDQHMGGHDWVFASEGVRYQHETWGDQNLRETFGEYVYDIMKNNEIFNVGVLAGRSDAMQALCLNLFYHAMNRPISICDQAVFNFLISQKPYVDRALYTRSCQAWACQAGTTADPRRLPQLRHHVMDQLPQLHGDTVVNTQGWPYCIVHQYDRVPAWHAELVKKYA